MGLLSKLLDWTRGGRSSSQEMPLDQWFVVTFDQQRISMQVEPPGDEAWGDQLRWDSIERICFKAEGLEISDGIYIFTSARPQSYVIPTEAHGGGELWSEILERGLFDPELAIEAASSLDGVFCWPAAEEQGDQDQR